MNRWRQRRFSLILLATLVCIGADCFSLPVLPLDGLFDGGGGTGGTDTTGGTDGGGGTDGTGGADGTGGVSPGGKRVMLRIVNESGLTVFVEAFFFVGVSQVRSTTRRLADDGPAAVEQVAPTFAEWIHIVARPLAPPPPGALPDGILADAEISVGLEAAPDNTITFVIPPPAPVDCNGNGAEDPVEIADGSAADCNNNGVPDECDLAAGTGSDCNSNGSLDDCDLAAGSSLDCNANSVPDACDLNAGTSKDCNNNGVPDECDALVPVVVIVGEQNRILGTDQDGTTPTQLIKLYDWGLGTLRKIALDPSGGRLFFTEYGISVGDDSVQVMPLTGGSPTALVTGEDDIGGIGVDPPAGRMYWSALVSVDPAIRRANLDGSGAVDLIAGLMGVVAKPAVDPVNGKIYFTVDPTQGTSDFIKRANLNGSGVETLTPSAVNPQDLELWPQRGWMFWAERGTGRGLYRAALDGTGVVQLAVEPTISGLAVDRDNCRVFWTGVGGGGSTDGFVRRADIDGANRLTILAGLDNPQDVATYPAP